jgi:hypothetical protein
MYMDFMASHVFPRSMSKSKANFKPGLYHKFHPDCRLPDPNYKNTLSEVLGDATRVAILERMDLDCLNWLHRQPEENADDAVIPSWVPRWHRALDSKVDELELRAHFSCFGDGVERNVQNRTPRDPSVLSVVGTHVDTIARIFDNIDLRTTSSTMLRILKDLHQAIGEDKAASTAGERAIAMTLIAGTDFLNRRPGPTNALEMYEIWRSYVEETGHWPSSLGNLGLTQRTITDMTRVAAEYDLAFENACHHRSIFITKQGRLGIGPQTMREGDTVAILYGCQWPVILRSLQHLDEFEVHGVSYIHGVMYGEALEYQRDGKIRGERIFDLK